MLLYKLDINHKVLEWFIDVDKDKSPATIIVYSGLLLGNKIHYISDCTYASPEDEVNARIRTKQKQGWKSLNELGVIDPYDSHKLEAILQKLLSYNYTDINNTLKPQKAVLFVEGKFNYPGALQCKLNGFRATLRWQAMTQGEGLFAVTTERAVLLSKEGDEYVMPHITNGLTEDMFKLTLPDGSIIDLVYDGELYKHGMPLNHYKKSIPIINKQGRVSKASLPPEKLAFWIFDLAIESVPQDKRLIYKEVALIKMVTKGKQVQDVQCLEYDITSTIVNLLHTVVHSDEQSKELAKTFILYGYEGAILRDLTAEYGFGKRWKAMQKIKQWRYTNCIILDVITKQETTINNNKRTYIALSLKNDLNDETFDCTFEGDEDDRIRLVQHRDSYIGRMARVKYRERSGVKNLPFQATVINIE